MCSKCWNEQLKKQPKKEENTGMIAVATSSSQMEVDASENVTPASPLPECTPCEPVASTPPVPEKEQSPKASPEKATKKKKKKKKQSYKALMASMTQCSDERDVKKEKENLKKVTGGGAFSKIDKI